MNIYEALKDYRLYMCLADVFKDPKNITIQSWMYDIALVGEDILMGDVNYPLYFYGSRKDMDTLNGLLFALGVRNKTSKAIPFTYMDKHITKVTTKARHEHPAGLGTYWALSRKGTEPIGFIKAHSADIKPLFASYRNGIWGLDAFKDW